MPIIKSAIKRVRQSAKRQARNAVVKKNFKGLIKNFISLVEEGKQAAATKLLPELQKAIDLATKKNLLHKNTAGRKKSQLMKMVGGEAKKAAPVKKAAPKKAAKASK